MGRDKPWTAGPIFDGDWVLCPKCNLGFMWDMGGQEPGGWDPGNDFWYFCPTGKGCKYQGLFSEFVSREQAPW